MCIKRVVESIKALSIGKTYLHDQSKGNKNNVNSMCVISLSYTHWKSELGSLCDHCVQYVKIVIINNTFQISV